MKDQWFMSEDKKKKSEEDKKKQKKYVPGGWRMKNDQGHGPGAYEVIRLMTVVNKEESEKAKSMKRFASIPTMERTTLGVINRVPPRMFITVRLGPQRQASRKRKAGVGRPGELLQGVRTTREDVPEDSEADAEVLTSRLDCYADHNERRFIERA